MSSYRILLMQAVGFAALTGFVGYKIGGARARIDAENYPSGSCAQQVAACEARGGWLDATRGKGECRKSVEVKLP